MNVTNDVSLRLAGVHLATQSRVLPPKNGSFGLKVLLREDEPGLFERVSAHI